MGELASDFLAAVRQGDATRVEAMLDSDAALASARDENGVPAIRVAVYHGRSDVLALLERRGAVLDIHDAAAVGNAARVRALLEQQPALVNSSSSDGWTPLHLAAHFGRARVVETLLGAGADLGARSRSRLAMGNTALHAAVAGGHRAIVDLLLARGAEVDARQDAGGYTPLHIAAGSGNVELVRLLLASGAAVNAMNEEGKTPLAVARERAQADAARVLDQHCGVAYSERAKPRGDGTPPPRTSGMAVASLLFGLFSLYPITLWLWPSAVIAAVVFAVLALVRIARSGGRTTGRGFACAGLAAGLAGAIAPLFLIPAVHRARDRARATQRGNAQTQLRLALESYHSPAAPEPASADRLRAIRALADRNLTPHQGSDLIGRAAPPWQLAEWAHSEPLDLAGLRGSIVFVRFWTNTCPYCEQSMPAIQQLADEFRDAPIRFIGIYHSKPRGSEQPWEAAVATAERWGVRFPIAYDRDWKTLDAWWLGSGDRPATSASFLIDPRGEILWIHPGPEFHPSGEPDHAACDRDFSLLQSVIRQAVVAAAESARENPPGPPSRRDGETERPVKSRAGDL